MILASLGNWERCRTLIETGEVSSNTQLLNQIIDIAIDLNIN